MNFILINTYSSLLSGLFMMSLGILVFFKNPRIKLNIIFLLFTAAMAGWLLFAFMMYRSDTDLKIIFWDRMVYLGVVFTPAFMYHFGLIFCNTEKENKKKLYLGYFLSFIFLVLSRTDYFVADLYKYAWGDHTQARIFHHLFLIFFFFYVFWFIFEISKFLRTTEKIKKDVEVNQVKYLFIAFLILNAGAYAFLPAYGIDINPIGAYWLETISVLILAFAITRYHLFNLKVILTEILVGVMGVILLILPFLMPIDSLKILTGIIFILFCIFGYRQIKYTYREIQEKEILEGKVKERTKEIEKRKEDLEKFYSLTVGRELKMAELKKKIKELEEEIKKE